MGVGGIKGGGVKIGGNVNDGSGEPLAPGETDGVGDGEGQGSPVERGERLEDAVHREVREETGAEVAEAELGPLYEVMSPEQSGFHVLMHVFRGRVRGALRAEEGSDVSWRRPEEVDLHPTLRRVLADAGFATSAMRRSSAHSRARASSCGGR